MTIETYGVASVGVSLAAADLGAGDHLRATPCVPLADGNLAGGDVEGPGGGVVERLCADEAGEGGGGDEEGGGEHIDVECEVDGEWCWQSEICMGAGVNA